MTETGVDLQRVLQEIDEEVRARRASGDFPPGMERDLDLIFARFAPASVSGDDLDAIVEAADRTSFIDAIPPTESKIPAVTILKKVERKLLHWFFNYLAQQVTAFAGVVTQALRVLSGRVSALEEATPGANPTLLEAARRTSRPAAAGALADRAAAHLSGVTGRVLVAEAGDGSLVRRLVDAGLDAYGVEPRLDLSEAAALDGLEVRADEVLDHLRAVDEHALAAMVLVGVVDRAPLGTQLAMADLAGHVVAAGGRIVVVATDPGRWGADNPVEADLAPGRPLRAATWAHLLQERGFGAVEVHESGDRYAVTATR
jgi:hypothetical protein